MFFDLIEGDWNLLRQIPIPEKIWESGVRGEESPAQNPIYSGRKVLPLVSPAALVLCETDGESRQSIGGSKRSWSRRINDRIFLAAYTGRELVLYRMEV
jgi:hypothetical protein